MQTYDQNQEADLSGYNGLNCTLPSRKHAIHCVAQRAIVANASKLEYP